MVVVILRGEDHYRVSATVDTALAYEGTTLAQKHNAGNADCSEPQENAKKRKKLSDFFTNEKVSLLTKQSTPILESDGSIVWVCGLRLDQRFRITPETRHVIKLEYSPLPPQ